MSLEQQYVQFVLRNQARFAPQYQRHQRRRILGIAVVLFLVGFLVGWLLA